MHKAGGIVALIAGLFCIAATFFVSLFSAAMPVLGSDSDPKRAVTYFIGGVLVSIIVIALSAIILGTRNRIPSVILIAFSVVAISQNWGSGFVTICLVFAIVGGIMALFK